jgi:hypothetical protein
VNLKVSSLGMERKKMAVLGALLLVLVYFLWPSSHGDEQAQPTAHSPGGIAPPPIAQYAGGPAETRDRGRRGSASQASDAMEEFRPSLRKVRQSNIDPSRIDPTLRLDLLAKLQNVKFEGDSRSLFEASETPPVKIGDVKVVAKGPIRPMLPSKPLPPPGPPPPPPPPPIPLKFYGFVNPANATDRRAFFLDGDDILVAGEGELLKKRYKIVRIGVSQAVVEDTQFHDQQKLDLLAEATATTG